MTARPRARHTDELDAAMLAACLGDPCPPDFNPFVFFDYEGALSRVAYRSQSKDELALIEAWPQLRPAVLAEWRRRKRRGKPPGCALDSKRKPA